MNHRNIRTFIIIDSIIVFDDLSKFLLNIITSCYFSINDMLIEILIIYRCILLLINHRVYTIKEYQSSEFNDREDTDIRVTRYT